MLKKASKSLAADELRGTQIKNKRSVGICVDLRLSIVAAFVRVKYCRGATSIGSIGTLSDNTPGARSMYLREAPDADRRLLTLVA